MNEGFRVIQGDKKGEGIRVEELETPAEEIKVQPPFRPLRGAKVEELPVDEEVEIPPPEKK